MTHVFVLIPNNNHTTNESSIESSDFDQNEFMENDMHYLPREIRIMLKSISQSINDKSHLQTVKLVTEVREKLKQNSISTSSLRAAWEALIKCNNDDLQKFISKNFKALVSSYV